MATGTYVAISAQIAMERRLEAIANNIANVNTAGYRAVGVRFSTELAQAGRRSVSPRPAKPMSCATRVRSPYRQQPRRCR